MTARQISRRNWLEFERLANHNPYPDPLVLASAAPLVRALDKPRYIDPHHTRSE